VSFEPILTSSSYELDDVEEGKFIADVLESGMGFVKLSDASKRRGEERVEGSLMGRDRKKFESNSSRYGYGTQNVERRVIWRLSSFFRKLTDAWLEVKFPDWENKKIEAPYQADDGWQRTGIDRYSGLAIFGRVSDEGGGRWWIRC
jgi:hypothetical protein